jgi:hypothetical protein
MRNRFDLYLCILVALQSVDPSNKAFSMSFTPKISQSMKKIRKIATLHDMDMLNI